MSLMIDSSASPLREIVEAYSRCSASSSVSPSRPLIPMIAFIGVRISWLIVARNALLDSFAASATSRASLTSANSRAFSIAIAACCDSPTRKLRSSSVNGLPARPPHRHHPDDPSPREQGCGHEPLLLLLVTGDRDRARVAEHVVHHLGGAANREIPDDPLARA